MPADAIITEQMLEMLLTTNGLTKQMNKLFGQFIVEENLWTMAMNLAMGDDDKIAFRSSWAVEWAYTISPEHFRHNYSERLILDFINTSNDSVHRVYGKMLYDLIVNDVLTLDDDQVTAIAEKCLDRTINSNTNVAVKVRFMKLLQLLTPRIEWLEATLTDIVRDHSTDPDCTPAMAAYARHYFKWLSMKQRAKAKAAAKHC